MSYASVSSIAASSGVEEAHAETRRKVRAYIAESFLLGAADEIGDSASLIDTGILDSTGALELASYLAEEFSIDVADEDLTPDNLDSVDRICRFVERKREAAA